MKIIGGFFPLHLPEKINPHNVLALWDVPASPHLFFRNGRSALHHLLLARKPKNIWLPSYCCQSLVQAAEGTGAQVRFFPLQTDLSPQIDYLKQHTHSTDAVLVIDYFGRNPNTEFLGFARSMPDIVWIEDRVQAFLPSVQSWGDYILYSPRKLLGVPDGGILVSKHAELPAVNQPWIDDISFIAAALARYEDKTETYNAAWYARSQDYENAMDVSSGSMSRLSRHILATTDATPLMEARHNNFNYLMGKLADIALLPANDTSFVPFGFPIRVSKQKDILAALYAKKIFAARHWPELPSDPTSFAAEHRLNAELITLPVDQRYGIEDMQRIVDCVRSVH